MPVYYGDLLQFSGYPGVASFQITTELAAPEVFASGCKGGMMRPSGAKSWSGRAVFLTPTSLLPGTRVDVVAAMDRSAQALTGRAVVSALTIVCDAATRGQMSWIVDFFGEGPLRIGGPGPNPSAPRIPAVLNPTIRIGNQSPAFRAWQLRMAVNPKRYLVSGNEGWVRHVVGGFDVQMQVVTIGDDLLVLDPGGFYECQASDGAGNTYQVRWMRPVRQENNVDPMDALPPGVEITLAFSSVNPQGQLGECIANGVRVWPTF